MGLAARERRGGGEEEEGGSFAISKIVTGVLITLAALITRVPSAFFTFWWQYPVPSISPDSRRLKKPPEFSVSQCSPAMASARVLALSASSALSRSSSRAPASNLISRRSMAGGDHHGPPKVNLWEDPMSPSKWKEEHFVLASLSGWGLLIYGGYKLFGGKKEKKEEAVPEAKH